MLEPTDRLEREVAAAFAEVLKPQPGDEDRLAAMIGAALQPPPTPPTTGAGRAWWLKLVAGTGGLVAIVVALAGPSGEVAVAPNEMRVAPEEAPAAAPREVVPFVGPAAPVRELAAGESTESTRAATRRSRRGVVVGIGVRGEEAAAEENAGSGPPPEVPEVEDPDALLRAANRARRARSFDEADRLYDELVARFPGSRAARTSRVPHGRLLLEALARPEAALACFSAYLADDPQGTLAEEALVGQAQALGRLGRTGEMQAAWRSLLARFPGSMHAATARALTEAGP